MNIPTTSSVQRVAAIAIGLSMLAAAPAVAQDATPAAEPAMEEAAASSSRLTPEVLRAAAESVNDRFAPEDSLKWAEVESFADLDALEEAGVIDMFDEGPVSSLAERAGVDLADVSHRQWNVKRPGSAFDLIHGEAFTLNGADPAGLFDAYVFTFKGRDDTETFEELEVGGKMVTAGKHLSGNSFVTKLRKFQLIGQGYVIYPDGDTVIYIEGDPEATAAFLAELP